MRVVPRVLALAVMFCILPVLHAADLTGTWKGSFDFNGDSVAMTLTLKADGNALTGTVASSVTEPSAIHDGKIDGDTISFWVNSDYQGQTYKLDYTGKVSGDHIDLNLGTEDGSFGTSVTVTKSADSGGSATPAPAAAGVNLTGAWKGTFDFQGNAMPLTFNLTSDGAKVTGNVEGMGPAPIEIHDGKVDGQTVTFWLNTEYQGQTYALNYTGKISGSQIDFDFGVADGSWGSSVTVKKS